MPYFAHFVVVETTGSLWMRNIRWSGMITVFVLFKLQFKGQKQFSPKKKKKPSFTRFNYRSVLILCM